MWQTKIFNGLDINAKIFDEFTIIVDISRDINSQRKKHVFNIRNTVTYERDVVKTEYECKLTSYKAPYIACLSEKEEKGKTLQFLETFKVENGTVNPLNHLVRCLPFLKEKAKIILCHNDGVYIATTNEVYFIPHIDPKEYTALNASEVCLYSSDDIVLKKYDNTLCLAEGNILILANSIEATIWNRSDIDNKLNCITRTKCEMGETFRKTYISPDTNHSIIVSSKTIYYYSSKYSGFIDLFNRETNIFDLDYSILNISKCVDNLCVYLDNEMLILGNVVDSIHICDLLNEGKRKSTRFSLRYGYLRYSNPKCKIHIGRVIQNYFYVINEQGYFSLFEISPSVQQFKSECPGFIGYRMDSLLSNDKKYLNLLLNINNKIVLKKWKTEEIRYIGRGHEYLRDDTYPESKLVYSDVLYISDKINNVKKRYFEIWPNLLIEHEPDQSRISSKCYDIDKNTKVEYIDKTNTISLTLPSKKTFELWCKYPHSTREFYDSLVSQKENSEVISKWHIDYDLFTDFASSNSRRIIYAKYNGMQVVLKFYERKDAFSSEFNSLRKLKHPSIMSLIGVSESGDNHIIIQPRLSTNLQKVIKDLRRERKHFKQCTVLKISLDIIKGLEYFHSFVINNEKDQIFHNDLKLDNILVVKEDLLKANSYEGQLVKISDFECSTSKGSVRSTSPFVERNRIKDNEYKPDDIKSFGNILKCIILRVVNLKECNTESIPSTWSNLLEYVNRGNVQAEDIKIKLLDIALDAISNRTFKTEINKLDTYVSDEINIYLKNETREWFKSTFSSEGLLNNNLIFIEGEKGYGKTTYLKCIKKFGKIQGFRCLSGEWEKVKLLQPFSAILNSIRNYISHYLIPTVLYDYIDTEVNDYFIRKEEVINLSPSRIWKSIFAIFKQISTEPTILLLDDLQNIDSVSLRYLPTLLNIPNLMIVCGSTKPITEYENLRSYKAEVFNLKKYDSDEILKIFKNHNISININILNALTDNGHPSRVHSLLMGILKNKIDLISIYKPNKSLYDIMWENLSDHTKDMLYIISCIKVLNSDRYLIQEIYEQMRDNKIQLYSNKKPKEIHSHWHTEAQIYGFLKNENHFIDEQTRKYVYNKIKNRTDIHYFIYKYLSKYIKKGIEFYHEILLQACECNFPTFEGYPINFQPSFFLNVALSVYNEDELKNIIEKAIILTINKKINFDEDTLAISQRCYDYGFYDYATILIQNIKEQCQHAHLIELKCLSKTQDYDKLIKRIVQIKESNIYSNDSFIYILTKVLFTIDPECPTSSNDSIKKIVRLLFNVDPDKSNLTPYILIWCAMIIEKNESDELFELAFNKLLEDSFNCYFDHDNVREVSLSLIYLAEYYLYKKQDIQNIFIVLNKAKHITEHYSIDDLTDRCSLDITMAYIIFSYSTNVARSEIKESIERYYAFGSGYKSQNNSILNSILILSGQLNIMNSEETNEDPPGLASIALKCYCYLIFEKYREAYELFYKASNQNDLKLQSSNGNINFVQSFYIFLYGLTSSLILMRNEDISNSDELKNNIEFSIEKLNGLTYNKNIIYYFYNILKSNNEVIHSNYNENTQIQYNQVMAGTFTNLVALTCMIFSEFLPFSVATSTFTREEHRIQTLRLFKRIGIIKQYKSEKEFTQLNINDIEETNKFWPMDFLLKNCLENQNSCNKLVGRIALNAMKFLERKTTNLPKSKQPEVLNINNIRKLTPKIFGNKHFCKLDVKSSYVELYDLDLFRNLIVFSIASIHEESNETLLYVHNDKDVSEHSIFKFYVSNHPRNDFAHIKYTTELPKRLQQKLSKFYQLDIEFGYYENDNNERILTFMFPFHKHKPKSHKIGYIGKNTFNQCSLKSKMGNIRLSTWENVECISHSADLSYLFVDIEPQEKNDQTLTKLKSYKDIHRNVKLVAVGEHLQDDIFDVVLKSSVKLEEYMEEARRGVTCNLF